MLTYCSILDNKTPELTKVPFHMNFYRWIILRLFIKFTKKVCLKSSRYVSTFHKT